ncbi:hypothetical protein ACFL0P_00465 [Candidatus Omnitrophota bacterium]
MNRNKLLLLILILAITCIAYGEDYKTTSFMRDLENRKGSYVYKKTSQPRSNFSSFVKRFSRDEKVFYKYTEHGQGDYDRYLNVTWEIDAEMEEKEDLLFLIYSNRIIRDKVGEIIVKYEKHFDYDERKIDCISSDDKGEIIKKKTFPIKGYTTDNITLSYCLKTFVAHHDDKTYRSFYLISSEPRLYRITTKVIAHEVLELPAGKINAIKLRLIPNFGVLTGLTGALIPPTYVWYTEKPPYTWLQYEGLEAGLGTSHIVVYISDFVEHITRNILSPPSKKSII